MNKIDCLLIDTYELPFYQNEKFIRNFGTETPFYRNQQIRFLKEENKAYSCYELFKKRNKTILNNENEEFEIFGNAVAYLGSFLHKKGYSFDYIISFLVQQEKLKQKLLNNDILSVAIITTTYVSPIPVKKIISFIKKYNSKVKIIVGGPYINGELRNDENTILSFMKSLGADYYINSMQGEDTLAKLIDALKKGKDCNKIHNLYIKDNKSYIKTSTLEEDNRLEENMINWSLFAKDLPLQVYSRLSLSCPFSCKFCDFPLRMGKYKYLEIQKIEEELDGIHSTGKVKSITFTDDTINIPKKRFKEMLKMMIKKQYNFKWNGLFRCQFADRETVELMAKSGCNAVHLGIESGSQAILKNMNKKADLESYRNGISLLNEYGITSLASFIIGFPGETENTINETLEFIETTQPTFYILHPWYCSPMTPIWEEREKYNIKFDGVLNWAHSTMDASTAMDYTEMILKTIKNSIHSPLHIQEITQFLVQGVTLNDIKIFLKNYNKQVINSLPKKQLESIL